MTDFINLKIKPTQFFRDIYKNKIYIHIFIEVNTHIYIYTVFLFKKYGQTRSPPELKSYLLIHLLV
jgi:hypothetical protein